MIGKLLEVLAPVEWLPGGVLLGFAVFERFVLLGRTSRSLTATWALALLIGSAGLARLYEGDIGMQGGPQWYTSLVTVRENLLSYLCLAAVIAVVDSVASSRRLWGILRRLKRRG